MKEVIGVRDKLVAEIIAEERTTKGGLIVPEIAVHEPQLTCKVISKGEEVTKEINIGDTIFCHQRAGMDIMTEGIILKILKDDEVFAIVKGEK